MQQNTNQQKNDLVEVDIFRILQNALAVLKQLWFVMLLVVALTTAAVVFLQQASYTPSYKSYCTFSVHVVNKSTLSDTNSLYAVYYDQDLAEQLDATFDHLVNSDFLRDDITEYLDGKSVDGQIHASSIEGSNIFILSATGSTPEKADLLLEALMAVYYDAARYVVGDMTTEIIEGPISSDTPYNTPNKVTAILMGGIVGVLLCLGIVILYSLFKRTVLEPTDLETHLNMPCFGVLPLLRSKRDLNINASTANTSREKGFFRESVRGIARKVENAVERQNLKVILVTSTTPGEGKSVMSQHLAEKLAQWGKKVVLIDGDLRKPSLYRQYGFKNKRMSLEEAMSGAAAWDTVRVATQNPNITLVLNSTPVKNPTVVINSPAMQDLINSFAEQADLVIIDTPPCYQLSDVSLYQQYADGILYVVQQDRMSIRQIVDAVKGLNDSENKLLGYVLNGAQQIAQGYGKYGYGAYSYGKYGKYGYGKYGYSKYGYGEPTEPSRISER